MLRAQLVVIPCVTFAARASFSAGSGALTPVELVTLRAIGLGLDDVDSIALVVGLGTRPVLDLIYDFWLRGYVVIDTAQGRVRLAGRAAEAQASGSLDRLASAENNIEEVHLVQELVSGAVLPDVARPRPPGTEASLAPTLRPGLDLQRVTRFELLDAVQREVARQARKVGRDLAIREAWVEPGQILVGGEAGGATAQQRRFMPVWSDIHQDPDSERLVFEIVEAPELPRPARQELARELSRLAERLPDQLFFKRLRQEFQRTPALDAPVSSETAIVGLKRSVAALECTDRGVVDARHAQLRETFDEACHEMRALARAAAEIRPVVGYSDHEREIRRLIGAAERQLVLGNPWVRLAALVEPLPGGNASWFDLLNDALGRGVQVFLLWGIEPDSRLDGDAATALFDLVARHQGRFVLSRRSSTLHAKFVVRDAHDALVTSFNFLDPPQAKDSLEMGLTVSGRRSDIAPEAVLDLLEWTRERFPDYLAAKRILLLPHELGASEPEPPELPLPPEAPTTQSTQSTDGQPAPAVKHWAHAWRAVSERLLAMSAAGGPRASLLVDREHREALWQALRNGESRIAVLSDRVSVDVVTDRFVRMLKARLDAGVPCRFLFRREGASDQDDGPAARLRKEASRIPEQCTLIEGRSHAKVLVCDDEVVVGSFNFLSYGGDYARGQRERAELSIKVRDPATVDEILGVLEVHWPGSFSALSGRRRAADSAAPASLAPKLQPLFHAMHDPHGTGQALLDWFGGTPDPWGDLRALERAGLSDDELLRAASAALASCPDLADSAATRWRIRVAGWRWRLEDFTGSALLLPDGEHEDCSLPHWLVSLGAAVERPPRPIESLPLEISDVPRPHITAAVAFLLVATLVQGSFEEMDALERMGEQLGGNAESWARAVRQYYETTYQALPLTLLRRAAGHQQRAMQLAEAKEMFGKDLRSAESIGFRFPVGEHTWELLTTDGHLLGELRLAYDGDDGPRLARYLASLDRQGSTLERLMDEASLVRDEHNRRIEEPKRSACLKRLSRVMTSARAWLATHQTGAPTPSEARAFEACAPLRGDLSSLRAESRDELDPVAGPALRFALGQLAPLLGEVPP